MEMVNIKIKRGFILSLFFAFNTLYSQDNKLYNKFQIGLQIFNESILSNNGVFADYNGMIFDDYKQYLYVNNPIVLEQAPRTYLRFNQSRVLGNINGGYHFDYYNSLVLYMQFSYRYNMYEFSEKNSAIGKNTDFGDLNFNLVYYRNVKISKILLLKLGIGAGLVFNTVNDLNDIYSKTIFSNVYNNENAYFFEDNKRVVTTKNLFRNSVDINLTPRFELDFTKERKSYFSLVGGMNIMPFDYLGVETKIYDLSSGQVTNSLKTKFKNVTFFIGIGYTFGWEKQEEVKENQYF